MLVPILLAALAIAAGILALAMLLRAFRRHDLRRVELHANMTRLFSFKLSLDGTEQEGMLPKTEVEPRSVEKAS